MEWDLLAVSGCMLFCRQCLGAFCHLWEVVGAWGIEVTRATTARAASVFGVLLAVTMGRRGSPSEHVPVPAWLSSGLARVGAIIAARS